MSKSKNVRWLCQCDCGKEIVVNGGNLRSGGTKSCGCLSDDCRKSRAGEYSPSWKGDAAKCVSLHQWLTIHKPRPDLCEWCRWRPASDLSFDHKLGKHTRNSNDYLWLCRSCHFLRDFGQEGVKPLTKARIHRIRAFYAVGVANLGELGKIFRMHHTTICDIVNYRNTYKEVTIGG